MKESTYTSMVRLCQNLDKKGWFISADELTGLIGQSVPPEADYILLDPQASRTQLEYQYMAPILLQRQAGGYVPVGGLSHYRQVFNIVTGTDYTGDQLPGGVSSVSAKDWSKWRGGHSQFSSPAFPIMGVSGGEGLTVAPQDVPKKGACWHFVTDGMIRADVKERLESAARTLLQDRGWQGAKAGLPQGYVALRRVKSRYATDRQMQKDIFTAATCKQFLFSSMSKYQTTALDDDSGHGIEKRDVVNPLFSVKGPEGTWSIPSTDIQLQVDFERFLSVLWLALDDVAKKTKAVKGVWGVPGESVTND